jgi:helicase
MHVAELSKYGIAPSLTDLWRACGHDPLLPIQQIAVQRYNLFGGDSLLVSAPTSSGKTFIGEMATANVVSQKGKAVYLVPLKALATEKFETFKDRYGPGGTRVVISTRDYREYDQAIEEQKFEIAVVVYEKMQQILNRKPSAFQGIKLVVADEIQMLADRERGADLEILLTRLRLSKLPLQFIGLSAVLQNNDLLSRWLGARFLEHYERPVELRRGILYRGQFDYRTYNAHNEGSEPLPGETEGPAWRIMMSCALGLAAKGEQSLIFLPDKKATRAMAAKAAEELSGKPAVEAIEELRTLEETRSRDMLIECLQSGIAFHNADLCVEERTVVERHFRQGGIRIICATPTLAVGVNLPVKNVFLEPELWDDPDGQGHPYKRNMTKAEYDNMGGRAGRLSLEDDFGRSILVATAPLHQLQFKNCFLDAELEPIEPKLTGGDLATTVMNLVASNTAWNRNEVARFLSQTYTGVTHARVLSERQEEFGKKIDDAVQRCVKYGVITDGPEGLAATKLGQRCAAKGIMAQSGYEINLWLESKGRGSLTEMEVIYALCRTTEARRQHMNMSTAEYNNAEYPAKLVSKLPREAVEFFGQVLLDRNLQLYERVKPMKVALILSDWVDGHAAMDIEEEYQSLAGTIRAAGEVVSWLCDAAASIANLLEFPKDQVEFLQDLSQRLEKGVPSAGVSLCRIRVRGFGRTHVEKLVRAGLTDIKAVQRATEASLHHVLGKAMGRRVQEFVLSLSASETPEPGAVAHQAVPQGQGEQTGPAKLFHCNDRFYFDTTVNKRNTVIVVNGVAHDITNKTFALLLRMAIQLAENGAGWIRGEEFGEYPRQAISNARKEIQRLLSDPKADIFENDGYGSYRLSVPPKNVSFDWEKIRSHWDGQIAPLAKLVAADPGRSNAKQVSDPVEGIRRTRVVAAH